VGAQVAVAVVLVTGATLLIRTLAAMGAVDPGFQTDGLVVADVTYPSTYGEAQAAPGYRTLLERVRSAPGVQGAALAATLPFGALRDAYATYIDGVTTDPNSLPTFDVHRVTPGWFEVMGIPLLEGRVFADSDRGASPLVAVVDELMARTQWPDASPVGRRIRYPWEGAPWIEVIGVVGSVADDDLTAPHAPRWYVPLAQRPAPNVTLVVRSALPAGVAIADLRRAVVEVDPRLPVSGATTYEQMLGASAARTRFTAGVLRVFALTTLFLGCLGVDGLAAHAVRERRREIGVRKALGAESGRIALETLRQGSRVAVVGALCGLGIAALATRALAGMLFGVTPLDPATFLAVPALMLSATALALWIPARRAADVDPADSLREG
jgi:predicted permease